MKTIKNISAKSLARVLGFVYGLLGVVIGIIFCIFSLFSALLGTHGSIFVGILFLVFVPIMYGLMGLVLGYITAKFYNYVAEKVGGVEFEVE